MSMHFHRAPLLFTVLIAITPCATAFDEPPDDNVIDELHFEMINGAILIPVTIENKKTQFVLCTVNSATTIDNSLIHVHDSPERTAQVTTNLGIRQTRIAPPVTFTAGSQTLVSGPAAVADFAKTGERREVLGIIGMDVLKGKILTLDFDRRTIRFLKMPPTSGGVMRALAYTGGVPQIECQINSNETRRFELDISNDFAMTIGSEILEKVVLRDRRPIAGYARTADFSGSADVPVIRFDCVSFGGFVHTGVFAQGALGNAIGLQLLNNYVMTFDFKGDRLYLQKGQRWAVEADQSLAKVPIIAKRINGSVLVTWVRRDSAFAYTVHANDELVSVGGILIGSKPVPNLVDELETAVGPLDLILLRDGELLHREINPIRRRKR